MGSQSSAIKTSRMTSQIKPQERKKTYLAPFDIKPHKNTWQYWSLSQNKSFRRKETFFNWQSNILPCCMLGRFSCVQLFATPWTVARQAPLSMEFSRQEYWPGLPCLPPGDFPDPGIKPKSLMFPGLAGGFFTTSNTRAALNYCQNGSSLTSLSFPSFIQ